MFFGGLLGCAVSGRRALGGLVAAVMLGLGAGLVFSSVSVAASQLERTPARGHAHVIRGGRGNEVLRGRPGVDVIYGGPGNDRIYGGRGNDRIYGGRGNDRIYGQPGNDVIDGGLGNDRIFGGRGNDVIHADRGKDRIDGGEGNDRIYGGPGKGVVFGGAGNDRIVAWGGPTKVFPGSGTNWIDVADGRRNDRVVCAAGSVDHVVADRGDRIARSCRGKGSTLSTGSGGVSNATWMRDLESKLWARKLSDIVIPGSHDTGTYGLPNDPISLIGKAQTEDITSQLNDGARSFDIRVRWSDGLGTVDQPCYTNDFYARHGILTACSLTLSDIFDQIEAWTNLPGHEQEIILVGLSIDQNGGGLNNAQVESQDCRALGTALGGALLTPSALQGAGYSADPGQVTLGQLWAMPGHPRVLLSDDTCMTAAEQAATGSSSGGAETWSPDPPFGSFSATSYYANQCYGQPYTEYNWTGTEQFSMPGIAAMVSGTDKVLGAADTRATQGGGDDTYPGDPVQPGPPMQGGLWTLFLQATPTWACLKSLADFDPASQKTALAALYQDWLQNARQIQSNVNIIAGDFVQDSDLVKDAIAMDETFPDVPGAITPVGTQKLMASSDDQSIPASAFAAVATDYSGAALPGAQVTYRVSGGPPTIGFYGPSDKRSQEAVTVTSDAQGDLNPGKELFLDKAGGATGTWTVTASTPEGGPTATWTVTVVAPTGAHLVAEAAGDTVQVAKTYNVDWGLLGQGAFAVKALDAHGNAVSGVPVTFNAGAAGTFPSGSSTVTVPTTGYGFAGGPVAVAPPLTAASQAGAYSISISAPGADNTLSLPFTLTAGPLARFEPTQGDGQSTPINTKFPVPLEGQWADQYGNPVAQPPPGPVTLSLDPASDGTWPNGQSTVKVTPNADGTITAPTLTAGNTVENNGIFADLVVFVGNYTGWRLQVTPGPATKVAATGGAGQQTPARKPFAHALTAKVTDARGHPVAGAAVLFKVTSGKATFGPVNLRLAAAAARGGRPRLPKNAKRRRIAVIEPTDARGVATAPTLTAGPKAGPIEVTAYLGASRKVTAVFHPSVVSPPRRR
jgi:hypothetical protein